MVVAVSEPVKIDHTIYVGTDHVWAMRRVVDNKPLIPSDADSQIRSSQSGELWIDCSVTIDPVEGWIYIDIPHEATEDSKWITRHTGVWDIEVVLNNERYRWAYGDIDVSAEVTK